MFEPYIERTKKILRSPEPRTEGSEEEGRLIVIGGNRACDDISPYCDGITIAGHYLPAQFCRTPNDPPEQGIFHHRVVIFRVSIPLRDHPETYAEVVVNDGDTDVTYVNGFLHVIEPGASYSTVAGSRGFSHGWRVERGVGALYVAKMLFPVWATDDSFR